MVRVWCGVNVLIPLCLLLMIDLSLAQSCGKRKVVNFLIVNGTEAKDGYWPWYVAIFHNNALTFVYACGGTILDQNTVLTAAHCLTTSNGIIAKERLVLQVGRNRLRVASKRAQEHAAFELIIHPEYNVNSIQHDIALIKLATDITYTDYIQPICLWNRGEDLNAIVGSWGTVVGFGRDETGNPSDTLQEANIPVVSAITCIESNRETFATLLTSNMFCAGNRDGIGACNGDSGGGLYFNQNGNWVIRGVVSFTKPRDGGTLCDTKEYTVFSDVAKYLIWIKQNIRGTGGQPVEMKNDNNSKIRLLPMSTCGANPYSSRNESSKPVLLGYPWMGLLECAKTESNELELFCQAILISDFYLITNAHCANLWHSCGNRSAVRLGEYDTGTMTDCAEIDGEIVCSPPVQKLRIESVIRHMGFSSRRFLNDIALIRLRDRADTSQNNVKPICLPVTNELRRKESTNYIVTSWHFYSYSSKVLEPLLERRIDLLMEFDECKMQLQNNTRFTNITSQHICVKQQQTPECKKPLSGAPLQLVQQLLGKNRYVLYGMLSFGLRVCGGPIPDVYTNVASYVDWILENIQD